MNKKRGFRRIAFILSIISACICAITGITAAIRAQEKWNQSADAFNMAMGNVARGFQERHPWPELDANNYFEEMRRLSFEIPNRVWITSWDVNSIDSNGMPAYTPEEREKKMRFMQKYGGTVCEKALAMRRAEKPWLDALERNPTRTLALISLGYAVAGFCGVWLCYFIAWLVYKLVMWVRFGFRTDTS